MCIHILCKLLLDWYVTYAVYYKPSVFFAICRKKSLLKPKKYHIWCRIGEIKNCYITKQEINLFGFIYLGKPYYYVECAKKMNVFSLQKVLLISYIIQFVRDPFVSVFYLLSLISSGVYVFQFISMESNEYLFRTLYVAHLNVFIAMTCCVAHSL